MKFLLTILFTLGVVLTGSAQRKAPFNGLLLDDAGNPVKNAHVYLRDHRAYALSTKKGEFGLTDVKPTDTLHVMVKKTLYAIPVDGKKSIVIRLADQHNYQAEQDQQLIDIGYGYVTRREHTGSAEAFIGGKTLADAGVTNIIDGLSGRVAGLQIMFEGGERKITMRGTKTLVGDSTPLFVLDGFPTPTLDDINVLDVDYIEVLKDGSIYGSQGANGAIVVWTKK